MNENFIYPEKKSTIYLITKIYEVNYVSSKTKKK